MTGLQGSPGVAVLASGEGTNLQAMIDAAQRGELAGHICLVLSDRPDAGALVRARAAGIASLHLLPAAYASRAHYDQALAAALLESGASLIVLAGFMRILEAGMVRQFEGRMLNIHPSLLPRHRGMQTHRRMLEAGEHMHGASVHFVVPELDAGPVLLQYRIAVQPWDTEASLARRVRQGEHLIYPTAVRWCLQGRVRSNHASILLDGQPLLAPLVLTRDGSDSLAGGSACATL
jgi:phosphoribosylglycinamide formyltransferase-1